MTGQRANGSGTEGAGGDRGLSDRELRHAWESAAGGATAIAGTPGTCPAADRIWAAALGQLGPVETREVVDHVAACPECAEAWRLAHHLGNGAVGVAAAPPVPVRATASRNARPWSLAAVAAVLVAALGLAFYQLRPPGDAEFRGGGGLELRPLVTDGSSLPRDRFELAWEEVPDAVEYDLRLTAADLSPVVSRRGLETPRFRVPPERLARLDDGSRLFWQVEAVLADGDREVSPTWEVVLAPATAGGGSTDPGAGRPPP